MTISGFVVRALHVCAAGGRRRLSLSAPWPSWRSDPFADKHSQSASSPALSSSSSSSSSSLSGATARRFIFSGYPQHGRAHFRPLRATADFSLVTLKRIEAPLAWKRERGEVRKNFGSKIALSRANRQRRPPFREITRERARLARLATRACRDFSPALYTAGWDVRRHCSFNFMKGNRISCALNELSRWDSRRDDEIENCSAVQMYVYVF